jgi:RHH-type proline utilization regulon transcriptional repressor/proline dehydrogenase/delta 1-pyrroline-5-carboxylate dehydrogenase
VLCVPGAEFGLLVQAGAALATGNAARIRAPKPLQAALGSLPEALCGRVLLAEDGDASDSVAVLFEGDGDALRELGREIAALDGAIRPIFGATAGALLAGAEDYPLELLLAERSTSTNTAAAGGNVGLMSL